MCPCSAQTGTLRAPLDLEKDRESQRKDLPKPPHSGAGGSDPIAKSLWLQCNSGGRQAPALGRAVLTCAGLFPHAAVLGPSSDVVQEGAAEKPLVQLCLQGADAEPDAHQPPPAADLQGEGECQGQLCQARVILCTGGHSKEHTGSHTVPTQWRAGHSRESSIW